MNLQQHGKLSVDFAVLPSTLHTKHVCIIVCAIIASRLARAAKRCRNNVTGMFYGQANIKRSPLYRLAAARRSTLPGRVAKQQARASSSRQPVVRFINRPARDYKPNNPK
jgi:hypothetical protein